MKSPPLHPLHHTTTAVHKLHNAHHHQDVISSQTPPNSPLPNSSSSSSSSMANGAGGGGTSLLLLNKHQLNNYNFHDYFDKLNSSLGNGGGSGGTSSPTPMTNSSLKSGNYHHLNGGGGGGGKKREHTPNQSTDELQLQLSSYLNPSYEDLNGSNGRFKISNSSGLMDAQKRQKLIKFSNSALDSMQSLLAPPSASSHQPNTASNGSNANKTNQKQQLQSALHFTSEIEKELSNLTVSIEKDLERQQYQSQQHQQQQEYYSNCAKCCKPVVGRTEACQAMSQIYHGSCFVCMSCGRSLRAKPFYFLNNQVYCEEDYLYSGFLENAEKCDACGHVIADMILQAMGKSYHPGCFRCFTCNECLDGVPFTLDVHNRVYCIKDYYKIYAPKCSACGLSISPAEGTNETIRIVAMEKDFHVECYVCEKCGVQLGDEAERRCYPLGKSLLCHACHVKQVEMSQLDPFMSSFSTPTPNSTTTTNVKSVLPSSAAARLNDFIYSSNSVGNNSSSASSPTPVIVKKNIQTENL